MTLTPARLRELIRFADHHKCNSLLPEYGQLHSDTAAAPTELVALRERLETLATWWCDDHCDLAPFECADELAALIERHSGQGEK